MAINPIKVWNGTAWEYTGPVVAAPPVKYQATAPTSPATGDVWVESDYDVASVDPSKLLTGGVYTNESTRSAAIPTPTTGMVTYVGDTGTDPSTIPQIETYTGSAWQTPYGLTLVANVNFTSASAVQVDNVFSSTYDNYLLLLEIVASGSYGVATQLCLSGTPAAGATDYRRQDIVAIASSVSATGSSTSSTSLGVARGTRTLITSTIGNPAKALPTSFIGHQGDPDSTFTIRNTTGFHILSTAYDGIRISGLVGGNGTLRIYGYRNS